MGPYCLHQVGSEAIHAGFTIIIVGKAFCTVEATGETNNYFKYKSLKNHGRT